MRAWHKHTHTHSLSLPPSLSTSVHLVQVGCVNNLSFYGQVEANVVLVHRLDFAQTLAPCLLSQNMDLVVEVARVFGNFSQSKEIRQLLVDNRGAPLAPKTRSFVGVRREGRGGDSCKCGHKLPSRMHTRERGQIAHTHARACALSICFLCMQWTSCLLCCWSMRIERWCTPCVAF